MIKGKFAHGQVVALSRRIPGVNPLAWLATFTAKLSQEAAIRLDAVLGIHTGGFELRRQEVGRVHKVSVDFTGSDLPRPVGDERHVHAGLGCPAFTPDYFADAHHRARASARAIVAEEENERVVADAEVP